MEPNNTELLVRLTMLESAVAALARGAGVADVLIAGQEELAKDLASADLPPNCFALLRMLQAVTADQKPG